MKCLYFIQFLSIHVLKINILYQNLFNICWGIVMLLISHRMISFVIFVVCVSDMNSLTFIFLYKKFAWIILYFLQYLLKEFIILFVLLLYYPKYLLWSIYNITWSLIWQYCAICNCDFYLKWSNLKSIFILVTFVSSLPFFKALTKVRILFWSYFIIVIIHSKF